MKTCSKAWRLPVMARSACKQVYFMLHAMICHEIAKHCLLPAASQTCRYM